MARQIAFALKLEGKQVSTGVKFYGYKAFTELDCEMLEINPLVVTEEGDVIALDAKMGLTATRCIATPTLRRFRTKTKKTRWSLRQLNTT